MTRLRNILEYCRIDGIIRYPGEYKSTIYPQHIWDICLRTETEKVTREGKLDSGVEVTIMRVTYRVHSQLLWLLAISINVV